MIKSCLIKSQRALSISKIKNFPAIRKHCGAVNWQHILSEQTKTGDAHCSCGARTEARRHSLEACPTIKASAESFHASAAGLKEGLWKTGKLAPLTVSFLRLQTQCSGGGCDWVPGSRLLGDPALDGRPITDYTRVGASTTDPACPFLPSLPLSHSSAFPFAPFSSLLPLPSLSLSSGPFFLPSILSFFYETESYIPQVSLKLHMYPSTSLNLYSSCSHLPSDGITSMSHYVSLDFIWFCRWSPGLHA